MDSLKAYPLFFSSDTAVIDYIRHRFISVCPDFDPVLHGRVEEVRGNL